jgi:Tol biopolymer transport system component
VAHEGNEQPLYKVPADGGPPVRLLGGVNNRPVWSPDGSLIVYCEQGEGPDCLGKGITAEGRPVPLPQFKTNFGGTRYGFLPGGKSLVLMLEGERSFDFWIIDLSTGGRRRLTDLRAGYDMNNFDVSADGKQIIFDRYRENSDVVLIDRAR